MIGRLLEELAAHREVTHATLDLDATIVSSGKREALFTYRAATGAVPGERGYQPMVAYCPELGAVVHTEFRDGNVPASREKKRVVAEALLRLPPRIEKVTVRADTAGYQEELIRFCNDPEVRPESLRRFGVIRFVCGAPRTEALMEAGRELPESDWQAIAGGEGREYAEVPFVPNLAVRQPDRHTLRYLAVRRPLRGQLGIGENDLPAVPGRPAMRLRFLFTNIPDPEAVVEPRGAGPESLEGAEVVDLAYGRCGEGEEIHAILKSDFAGGMMPSGKFGANACWWQWAAVSHDVVALLRVCALGTDWLRVRMKRLRAKFFHLAARVVRRGAPGGAGAPGAGEGGVPRGAGPPRRAPDPLLNPRPGADARRLTGPVRPGSGNRRLQPSFEPRLAPGGRPTSLPVGRRPPVHLPLPASDPPDGPLLRPSPPPARGSGENGASTPTTRTGAGVAPDRAKQSFRTAR